MHLTRHVTCGLALAMLLPVHLPAQHRTGSPTAVITTSGVGEVVIPPHWVQLRFGVSARDSASAAAADLGQRLVDRVIDTLQALGVERDSLQTAGLQVVPNRDYEEERRIINYDAEAVVRLALHDLEAHWPIHDRGHRREEHDAEVGTRCVPTPETDVVCLPPASRESPRSGLAFSRTVVRGACTVATPARQDHVRVDCRP